MGRLTDVLAPLRRGFGGRAGHPASPQPPPAADAPAAGTEPAAAEVPGFQNRARLRRRLRYLRQTRELGFRDLGGFVFDSKRFGREREDIVSAKLEALGAIDRELRALEVALADVQEVTLLHEPGIAVCPRCGALHGSQDNYCPGCALPVGRGLGLAVAQGGPGGAVPASSGAATPPATAPAAPESGDPDTAEPPPGDPATGDPPTAEPPTDKPPTEQPTTEQRSVAKQ